MRNLNALAWRNLRQHPLRTILSALAIALGVAMVIGADMVSGAARSAGESGVGDSAIGARIMGGMLNFGLNLAGVVILIAAGFLIFNAFAMTITQRRGQIGALRSLGMTRRQVLRLILLESLLTSLFGVILGVIGGPLLGGGIMAVTSLVIKLDFGDYSASFVSILNAIILGLVIAMGSTFIPARNAATISPLAALREPESDDTQKPIRWPLWAGLAIIALMAIYFLLAPPSEWTLPPWDYALSGLFALVWFASLRLILPALVNGLGGRLRAPLSRLWPAAGRLIADNLRRQPRRIMLTIITLAIGLGMIVTITGVMELLVTTVVEATAGDNPIMWTFSPIDMTAGVELMNEMDFSQLSLSPAVIESITETVAGRATIIRLYMVEVPETAFLIPHMPSFVVDGPLDDQLFSFYEGAWESARPLLDSDCGLLIAPMVATNNNVWLGDTLSVTGVAGSIDCMVAGIGGHSLMNVSLIRADPALFGAVNPSYVIIGGVSASDSDLIQTLDRELRALGDDLPGVWVAGSEGFDAIANNSRAFRDMMVGPLLLAILAAALGVVNTTMMSINERRRELGLLRAVGSTRGQVRAVVTGEAALIGLIGASIGFIAGMGCVVIVAVVAGGNAFGVRLDIWATAWSSVQATLTVGFMGLIASPIISALAAWLPLRRILHENPIETLALR